MMKPKARRRIAALATVATVFGLSFGVAAAAWSTPSSDEPPAETVVANEESTAEDTAPAEETESAEAETESTETGTGTTAEEPAAEEPPAEEPVESTSEEPAAATDASAEASEEAVAPAEQAPAPAEGSESAAAEQVVPAFAPPPEGDVVDKVQICHATGSESHPYESIEPSVNSIVGSNGHDTHAEDIIPPFTYQENGQGGAVVDYPGKNWDAEGQAIYANDCAVPATTTPPAETTPPATTPPAEEHKVTICHATPPDGSNDKWEQITVDYHAIVNEGHGDHAADIIPPFDFGPGASYPGKNWDEEGQAIFDNDCALVTTPPTTTPPATTPPAEEHKVTICHATPPEDAKNGWNEITVDYHAIIPEGHSGHAADIIPPFDFGPGASYPGKNWTETGQEILRNGCVNTQPADLVTTETVQQKTCTAGVEERSRTITTPYVFDLETWTWKLGAEQVGDWSAWTHVRDLNAEEREMLHCDTPDRPDDVIQTVTEQRKTCAAGVQERWHDVVTTYTWVDGHGWIGDTETGPWSDWTKTRDLTADERRALACDAVPAQAETPGLATTGAEFLVPGLIAAGTAMALGALTVLARRRQAR